MPGLDMAWLEETIKMTLRNVEGATPEQKRALLLKLVAEQQAGGASDSADQAPPAAVAQEKTARQR